MKPGFGAVWRTIEDKFLDVNIIDLSGDCPLVELGEQISISAESRTTQSLRLGRTLGNNSAARYIPECMDTISCEILADSRDYYDFCFEVVHQQANSHQ